MALALRLARRGIWSTHPNPNVGCVIVKGGEVVGRGWHRQAGGPHAEVFALREAGERARGADVYLTLEPCSHQGRTPPCADALVEAGVKRVVVAMQDPNPRVAGGGLERLRAAGIEVETGLLEAQARRLNPGFVSRMERGRPWLRLKLAASLDGRTAMASGESRWITGDAARRDVQRLRARSSAIVTGIGTVLADDPSLNVRLQPADLAGVEPLRQPLRVVLDSRLRMPPAASMLRLPGETLVLTTGTDGERRAALERAGARVESVEARDGRPDPAAVLRHLAEQEVNEVLLECGPQLAGAFLQAGLVDELILYLAPHLMGDDARGLFRLPGLEQMRDRIALEWLDVRQVGNDLRLTLSPLGDEGGVGNKGGEG
ncbi:MAG TPA: bifunctional diaminohydroxyphosphoribosylaminopyrimidine deaminase/5-amino-6-(5-phosphoribosylamino)uracil reductase RibD [Gammaproteobacteria bacterium]|nr:bifunctional diaminohydroxyphosphoribosylaminopyrimidine deaminase/5-amino-6-(5-phosphoribosylamino)uracil reductase RibD [Gammaproteobacteria bacterium]